MTKDQNDRLVLAFVDIAAALKGLHEEIARAGKRYWPEPGQQREPVLSRVPNEEDEARRNLGISDGPIEDWIALPDDGDEDEFIGEREREWRKAHPKEQPQAKEPDAGPGTPKARKKTRTSPSAVKGKG